MRNSETRRVTHAHIIDWDITQSSECKNNFGVCVCVPPPSHARTFPQATEGGQKIPSGNLGCRLLAGPAQPSLPPGSLWASLPPSSQSLKERKEFVIFAAASKHRPRGPGGINYKNLMNKIPQHTPPNLHYCISSSSSPFIFPTTSFPHSFTHSRILPPSLSLSVSLTCQVSLCLS